MRGRPAFEQTMHALLLSNHNYLVETIATNDALVCSARCVSSKHWF